jgi:hypothetical protein
MPACAEVGAAVLVSLELGDAVLVSLELGAGRLGLSPGWRSAHSRPWMTVAIRSQIWQYLAQKAAHAEQSKGQASDEVTSARYRGVTVIY